mmetsp:Transcript_48514/g.105675  ORF Transcript_48514/g.105675 Transcript_48514/m.105675 type:complete len:84 (-) Transcript_48514:1441-1692(-)
MHQFLHNARDMCINHRCCSDRLGPLQLEASKQHEPEQKFSATSCPGSDTGPTLTCSVRDCPAMVHVTSASYACQGEDADGTEI